MIVVMSFPPSSRLVVYKFSLLEQICFDSRVLDEEAEVVTLWRN